MITDEEFDDFLDSLPDIVELEITTTPITIDAIEQELVIQEELVIEEPEEIILWICACGRNCGTKHRLKTHMDSMNCNLKRQRMLDQSQPHQLCGSKLRECIDTHKRLKERDASDESIK